VPSAQGREQVEMLVSQKTECIMQWLLAIVLLGILIVVVGGLMSPILGSMLALGAVVTGKLANPGK
jgi:hypothetical protein